MQYGVNTVNQEFVFIDLQSFFRNMQFPCRLYPHGIVHSTPKFENSMYMIIS